MKKLSDTPSLESSSFRYKRRKRMEHR
jgi:hypothetical protein